MKVLFLSSATKSVNSYPHLGMAILSTILTRAGHTVRCIDGSAPHRTHTNEAIVDECVAFGPDVICVTATTERVKYAYHLLALLRNRLGDTIPIIAGGPHASIRPVEMAALGFDVAVAGAAETRITEIIEAVFRHDEKAVSAIPGVAVRKNDGSVFYSGAPGPNDLQVDFSTLLPVDFSAFEERDYMRGPADSWRFGHLLVGRGCPGCCTYCDQSVFGRKLQLATPEKIIADMLHRRRKYNVSHFYFLDDTLLWNKKAIVEICGKIEAEKELSGCNWGCNARPNLTDNAILAAMKKAGCTTVTLGIESGSEETLRKIRKNIEPATMILTFRAFDLSFLSI
jgi:radical SAM superfamily enzyme YgiQ (UPF0313 family)